MFSCAYSYAYAQVSTTFKTNKWVRSSASASAYAYVVVVLNCLCLCYAYAYAYALVRTGLKSTPSIELYWKSNTNGRFRKMLFNFKHD